MIRWAGFPAWADWTDSKPILDFEPKVSKFQNSKWPHLLFQADFELSKFENFWKILSIFSENWFTFWANRKAIQIKAAV